MITDGAIYTPDAEIPHIFHKSFDKSPYKKVLEKVMGSQTWLIFGQKGKV